MHFPTNPKKYKGYLIDLDGTMYRGNEPIRAAVAFVNKLHKTGIRHMFITNNSSKSRENISQKQNQMGEASTPEQIVTSRIETAMYCKGLDRGGSCYLLWGEGPREALTDEGFILTEDGHCDFVVIGIDSNVTYEKYFNA